MTAPAIEIENLTKDFTSHFWKPKTRVLNGVSFRVNEGDVFGLVGPNGAGKTTTIKMLMGLIHPTNGNVKVFGQPVWDTAVKNRVGYLPENAYYYDYLYTEEVIDFYGRLFGLSRSARKSKTEELLRAVGLHDRRGVRLRNFSKGMLQRIGIAQALVNDPTLIILDEPMSGLDPIGRMEVRDIILRLAAQGKTILFSSHILSDVEAICNKVAILIRGVVQACGEISDLVRSEVKATEVVFRGALPKHGPELKSGVTPRCVGDQCVVRMNTREELRQVLAWGQDNGLDLISVTPEKETLEDLFLTKVEEKK